MRAMTIGEALIALESAKLMGWDWTLTSSWCSDMSLFVCRLRRPGQEAHAARTRVGSLEFVLTWAYEEIAK